MKDQIKVLVVMLAFMAIVGVFAILFSGAALPKPVMYLVGGIFAGGYLYLVVTCYLRLRRVGLARAHAARLTSREAVRFFLSWR